MTSIEIGVGGSGVVYKANLSAGQVVAVKKFHLLNDVELPYPRSLRDEIQALTEIRRNIVKLYGFCCHAQCSFLVYEYIERESLASMLSNEEGATSLDGIKRVNIIRGVAHSLAHMHHNCNPPIVHRDVSSNNILLNLELEARLSDFGVAKILKPNSSNWSSLAGTYGYVDPSKFLFWNFFFQPLN